MADAFPPLIAAALPDRIVAALVRLENASGDASGEGVDLGRTEFPSRAKAG